MKISTIIGFIVIVIVGFSLNKLIPSGIKEEARNLLFEPPIIYVWIFFLVIIVIVFFYIEIKEPNIKNILKRKKRRLGNEN